MPLYKPSSPSLLEICTKQSQNPRYSLPCGERRRLQLLAGRILGWKKVKFPTWPYRAVGIHRLVVETGADHVERRHRHRHGHAAHHAPRQHRGPAALPEPLREAAAVSRARHFGDWTRCMPDAHRCWILVQDRWVLTWCSQTQSLAEAKVASCAAEPTATRGTAPDTPRHSPATPCCL